VIPNGKLSNFTDVFFRAALYDIAHESHELEEGRKGCVMATGEIRVLLVTDRPAVQAFFLSLGKGDSANDQQFGYDSRPFMISHFTHSQIPIVVLTGNPPHPERFTTAATNAALAVVDVMPNPSAAIQVCQGLHARQPSLPIAALFCCPNSVATDHLQALVAAGVGSLLDLQGTTEDIARALSTMARGDLAIFLHMSGSSRAALKGVLAYQYSYGARDEATSEQPSTRSSNLLSKIDNRLIELVARGLSDREIGQNLHISPHTVKHHIERLRAEVGVKNRIELAAWAGQQGLYQVDHSLPRRSLGPTAPTAPAIEDAENAGRGINPSPLDASNTLSGPMA
jgi:DNA-binding NarL/FixJ family response regulator